MPTNAVVPLGEPWLNNNLWWNGLSTQGQSQDQISPLNGQIIQATRVLTRADLNSLFECSPALPTWAEPDIYDFALRLCQQLQALAPQLQEATQLETAFSATDCDEIVRGTLSYLEGFRDYHQAVNTPLSTALNFELGSTRRQISLHTCPWGTVAVMLPQNALLLLGVVCIINALITGNRIVLRSPIQSARTAAFLGLAVMEAQPPSDSISIVVAKGKEFLEAAYASENPLLIHYLGASEFGGSILKNAIEGKKPALLDGTGNVWVYVSASTNPEHAAKLLTEGATRYNGQTCTSINGAIIDPDIFEDVCDLLQPRWQRLTTGDPRDGAQIGGLFNENQAQYCQSRVQESGGKILCGGHRNGNLLTPTLVKSPAQNSELVTEGVFGPVLWLRAGSKEDFVAQWSANRYPLCAGIFDSESSKEWWLNRLSNVARLVFDGDPSNEHIYEPWGGYPSSGANTVSFWHQKYQRVISIDAQI